MGNSYWDNLKIYSAREGYNLIAKYYDNWKWQLIWKKYEYPFIEKWCNSLESGTGFDAGTGTGNNLDCFLANGHKITGIDVSYEMLLICQQKHKEFIEAGQLICKEEDILRIHGFNRTFDWLICNRVLSNIQNLENAIKVFSNFLKANGQCFISDIHPKHNYSFTGIDIGNQKVNIETYKHSLIEFERLFKKYDLEVVEFKEMNNFDFPYDYSFSNSLTNSNELNYIFFFYILKKRGLAKQANSVIKSL